MCPRAKPKTALQKTPQNLDQTSTQEYFGGKIIGGTLSQMANYSDLFLRMPDPIFLLDINTFAVLESNPAASALLSSDRTKVVSIDSKRLSSSFLSHLDLNSQKKFQTLYLKLTEAGQGIDPFDVQFGIDLNSSEEAHVLELNLCVVKLADYSKILQVIARDVTQLRFAQRELEKLSITDEMTTLHNHRAFMRDLEKEHIRATRYKTPYSVIFIDVDHFKKYNDRNGHPAGDRVLKKVAQLLKAQCRNTDTPYRYGGEEFVILCPGVDALGASRLAESVRNAIAIENFEFGEHQPLGRVSASLGVAGFPEHAKQFNELLKLADDALYQSKHAGRNRVTVLSTKK